MFDVVGWAGRLRGQEGGSGRLMRGEVGPMSASLTLRPGCDFIDL